MANDRYWRNWIDGKEKEYVLSVGEGPLYKNYLRDIYRNILYRSKELSEEEYNTLINHRNLTINVTKADAAEHVKTESKDMVNSPNHYMHGGIETIEVIKTMLTYEEFKGYLKGNIIKYRERAPYKGNTKEDYAKAAWYKKRLDKLEAEEGNAKCLV